MMGEENLDQRLERLARATHELSARPGFRNRVLSAVKERAPSWITWGLAPARRLLPVAALAAVAALLWAVQSERSIDDELAASYASVEIEW